VVVVSPGEEVAKMAILVWDETQSSETATHRIVQTHPPGHHGAAGVRAVPHAREALDCDAGHARMETTAQEMTSKWSSATPTSPVPHSLTQIQGSGQHGVTAQGLVVVG